MRRLIFLSVILAVCATHSQFVLAGDCVSYQFKLSDANCDASSSDSSSIFHAFRQEWSTEGVEQAPARGEECLARERPAQCPPIEVFSGLWAETASFHNPSRSVRTKIAAAQPQIDMHWLLKELWPRTRQYLAGEEPEPVFFGMCLATVTESSASPIATTRCAN
jgi:hypothetical protein